MLGVFDDFEDRTYQIHLNQFFPSVSYSKMKDKEPEEDPTYEDKNIPINVTVFQLPEICSNASENAINLILLLKFASSGSMKTSVKTPWITIESSEVKVLIDIVCQPSVVTHAMATDKNITFLVLVNHKKETQIEDRCLSFQVANQRDRLQKYHKIVAMNNTREVIVMVRYVKHSQQEIENLQLMMWLYRRYIFVLF